MATILLTLGLWRLTIPRIRGCPKNFKNQNDRKGCNRDYLDAWGHFVLRLGAGDKPFFGVVTTPLPLGRQGLVDIILKIDIICEFRLILLDHITIYYLIESKTYLVCLLWLTYMITHPVLYNKHSSSIELCKLVDVTKILTQNCYGVILRK